MINTCNHRRDFAWVGEGFSEDCALHCIGFLWPQRDLCHQPDVIFEMCLNMSGVGLCVKDSGAPETLETSLSANSRESCNHYSHFCHLGCHLQFRNLRRNKEWMLLYINSTEYTPDIIHNLCTFCNYPSQDLIITFIFNQREVFCATMRGCSIFRRLTTGGSSIVGQGTAIPS